MTVIWVMLPTCSEARDPAKRERDPGSVRLAGLNRYPELDVGWTAHFLKSRSFLPIARS